MVNTLREAQPDDAVALAGLLAELGYPESGAGLGDRLTEWVDHPDRTVLVAHDGPDLLGLLVLTMTPRIESERWWAQVVGLVVTTHARGRGVGRDLLVEAEHRSAERGCDAVIINSSRRRSDAHAFYTALGYRDRCEDHAQFIRQLGP